MVLLLAGIVVLFVGFVILRSTDGEDPVTPVLGPAGLGALGLAALARAARAFREGSPGDFPTAVGRRRLAPARGLRARMVVTFVLALALPMAATAAFTALVDDGWALVAFGAMMGGAGLAIERSARRRRRTDPPDDWPDLATALERLCMRTCRCPSSSWSEPAFPSRGQARGRLHVTATLLEKLDATEVEAVLEHELAHIGHRDAAVMDVATAPSRAPARDGRRPPSPRPAGRAVAGRAGGRGDVRDLLRAPGARARLGVAPARPRAVARASSPPTPRPRRSPAARAPWPRRCSSSTAPRRAFPAATCAPWSPAARSASCR